MFVLGNIDALVMPTFLYDNCTVTIAVTRGNFHNFEDIVFENNNNNFQKYITKGKKNLVIVGSSNNSNKTLAL